MGLDTHAYSTAILFKIVWAGGQVKSFDLAASAVRTLAELSISARHLATLTHEVGEQLRDRRDQDTQDYLHHRRKAHQGVVPQAVAVAVDGGFLQTREPGHGPGVHAQGWREAKVACLHTLSGPTFADDPQPDPPDCFLDPEYVDQLVKDIQAHKGLAESVAADEDDDLDDAEDEALDVPEGVAGMEGPAEEAAVAGGGAPPGTTRQDQPAAREGTTGEAQEKGWPPVRLVRSCVATQRTSRAFGPLVAQEAHARGFDRASRRAYLGDGQKYNWTIQRKWFREYEAIADFIHPLSYLYVAATAVASWRGEDEQARWKMYQGWLVDCWQGRVGSVIETLKEWQAEAGPISVEEKPPGSDVRVVLARTVTYLENNQKRMDYPRYRCLGLPITSCAVESLIKEFSYRTKGSDKFWNRPEQTETILQVRAAVLSQDDRLEKFLDQRPGSPWRRYRSR